MMSAHGIWYSPAGNLRARVPGITTLRAGMRPRSSTGSEPVTSMMAVEAVSAWKFVPARKNGRAVKTRMAVPIVFTLNEEPEAR